MPPAPHPALLEGCLLTLCPITSFQSPSKVYPVHAFLTPRGQPFLPPNVYLQPSPFEPFSTQQP